jgi:hypothetical protein
MHWNTRQGGAWFLKRADVQQSLGQMRDRQTCISTHDGILDKAPSHRRNV